MNDFEPLSQEERNAPFKLGGDVRKEKPRDRRPFVRSSPNAPPPPSTAFNGRRPVRTDVYREHNGAPSLVVERFEWADPEAKGGRAKRFRQHSLRGDESAPEWVEEGFPDGELLPLLNLLEILANPGKPIVLVEGEKKVDAARVIFGDKAIPTTAAMGAFSIHRTDWSPVAGRTFIAWRDHDVAGERHLRAAAEALNKVGCRILVIDVGELVKIDGGKRGVTRNPDGWDCVDALVEWTDPGALRAKAMEFAKPYEDGTCTDYTTVPKGPEVQEKIRSELSERIDALNGMDENRARAIVADAVRAGLSMLAVESLLGPLAKKLGVTLPSARKFWREIQGEISAEDAALEKQKYEALSRDARDAAAREEARRFEEECAEKRERLEVSCREIAHDPKLLARLTKTARQAGVIGEDESIRSAYIAASSRFNRRKAICLLRRGAPAGGKNFVTDTVLRFIPEEDVIRVSSGSPLSLVYYGDDDENALKHKIVYVAEAAILAERNGVESVLTVMLRLLISEGRIDHQVVVTRPNAPAATVHIRRNGPVVVLITSARNNIEEELLTRLMTSDADESQEQTENVVEAALTDEDGEESKETLRAEIDQWADYQRWIALDAPFDVLIPYRPAIRRALRAPRQAAKDRGEKPKFKLRMRRDIHGFLTAIRTSAILHKAQREKDEKGRIIATLDDYHHAHEAFDPGLASLYKVASPMTTIAVVRAIEEMGATSTKAVKVTVTALMEKLGISGRGTANDRLRDAEDRGYIKLVEKPGGYGRTTTREYTIEKYAAEIEQETKSSFGSWVFPSREAVEAGQKNSSERPQSSRYSGTDSTRRATEPDYTACTTVPKRPEPSEKKNSEAGSTPDNDGSEPNIRSDNRKEPEKPLRWTLEL